MLRRRKFGSICSRATGVRNMDVETYASPSTGIAEQPRSERLLSVDLLRGLTIGFMILVNDPGDSRVGFPALEHADWNGFTPTDLVFPTFLFLVGVSMVLSYARREASGQSRANFLRHALQRALLLFAIGFMLSGFPLFPWHTIRIYGVLQRIALCFGAGSILLACTRDGRSRVWTLLAALGGCLLGYWLLLRFVPVPGHGLPLRDVPFLDKDNNLVAWLDRKLMPGRLYEGTRDPEGLLSTIPAVGTLILGMLAGIWLRTGASLQRKAAGLLAAGLSSLLLGGWWNLAFPINKKMWTSSYVLWAGGWSLLLLALFFWLCEVRGRRGKGWAPLLVFGRNAITSYVFAELLAGACMLLKFHGWPWGQYAYTHWFAGVGSPAVGSLLYSLTFVAVCWVPMLVLYRRRVFLKL